MKIPPPSKRLCKKHRRPIAPSLWLAGHRNQSCSECQKERIQRRNKIVAVPPPEKRLCLEHDKPIKISSWLHGSRTKGCSKCSNNYSRSVESRERRAKKWETTFIACRRHSHRRCSKGRYVWSGKKLCGSCHNKYPNGRYRVGWLKAQKNYRLSNQYRSSRNYSRNPRGWVRRISGM